MDSVTEFSHIFLAYIYKKLCFLENMLLKTSLFSIAIDLTVVGFCFTWYGLNNEPLYISFWNNVPH